ncbi:tRNA(Ile)-lysidine synthase [Betaproteobacteria bacterium]|nr:tRNA(Ile)-lysidine synthase [Betaproteobacteria bacterium]
MMARIPEQALRVLPYRVGQTLEAAGVGAAQRLCCALSGGIDSVVLLDVLASAQARYGFSLEAAHVHHGLNPAADDWAAFCAGLCRARNLPLQIFRVAVARDHPDGLEAAARHARHAALAQLDCDWLVLGHHRDDQAETVLFRLLRGAGVRGAAAMRTIAPGADGHVGKLRPLLTNSRAEIHAYAQARGLHWVDDDSNGDPRFARNDLRLRLIPTLETSFPGARATLARAATHFGEAATLLDELAALDSEMAAEGNDAFTHALLLRLSDARLANLLRWRIRTLGGLAPSAARLTEALRQLRTVDGPLRLPLGELVCYSYRGRVWLAPPLSAPPAAQAWQPGAGTSAWAGGAIDCHAATGEGIAAAALAKAHCRFTTRPPGLKLRLSAEQPARHFKDLCQQAGIPGWLRDHLPVLEVDGQVAWVGGIGTDVAYACAAGAAGWRLVFR